MHSATLLADVVKCFENVPHAALLAEAVATDFPLGVLRLALASYCAARRLVRDGTCSRDVRATRSVLAGCVHATALLRCLLLRALGRVIARWPGIAVRVVAGDITVHVFGTERAARRRAPEVM